LQSGQREVPHSLKNWSVTLRGLEEIVSSLKDLDFNFLLTRNINQDPLENFFCQIREHDGRNVNAAPTQFRQYFKTILINNYSTAHSLNANCQEEGSADILSSVKMFVTQGVAEEAEVEPLINFNEFVIPSYDYSYLTKISLGYVSGFIVKKLKLPCETCKSNVVCTDAIAVWHNLSLEKEYVDKVPKKLKYCTPKFLRLLCQYYNIIMYCLPKICHLPNRLGELIGHLEHVCVFQNSGPKHDIKRGIINKFTMLCSHNWTTGINRYLCGKTSKPVVDAVFTQARQYYLKNRRKK
jgi:hypothetical protein